METDTNASVRLDKYLACSPENIEINPDIGQKILSECIDSTISALEKLEEILLAFDSGQIAQDECIIIIRRILHNIKGEAGIIDFGTISSVCHHAESLLCEDSETIPIDTLFSVKDWLTKTMQCLTRA